MKTNIREAIEEGKYQFTKRYGTYPNIIRMGDNILEQWTNWQKRNSQKIDLFHCLKMKLEYDVKNPDCFELEKIKEDKKFKIPTLDELVEAQPMSSGPTGSTGYQGWAGVAAEQEAVSQDEAPQGTQPIYVGINPGFTEGQEATPSQHHTWWHQQHVTNIDEPQAPVAIDTMSINEETAMDNETLDQDDDNE